MFSGLNLAFFSLSRLRLEIEADNNNDAAKQILSLRNDANFLLTTILWGNVGINVLLTLLCESVLAGIMAFLFSTVFITLFGEILPQAFFSRHALRTASLLTPVLRAYQILLYPVAKPSAWILDQWLGKEGIMFWREQNLKLFILKHIGSTHSDVSSVEGMGAINFLSIDDLPIGSEGEPIDPASIIKLPEISGLLQFPEIRRQLSDPFLRQVNQSKHSWIILTNEQLQPKLLLKPDHFLRDALLNTEKAFNPYEYCHKPILITDPQEPLWKVILLLKKEVPINSDAPLIKDVVLLWSDPLKKVITGADLLGRLLQGIG